MDILKRAARWFPWSHPEFCEVTNASLDESLSTSKVYTDAQSKWKTAQPNIEKRIAVAAAVAIGLIALSLSHILSKGASRLSMAGIYTGSEMIAILPTIGRFYHSETSISTYLEDTSSEFKGIQEKSWDALAEKVIQVTIAYRLIRKFDTWLDT